MPCEFDQRLRSDTGSVLVAAILAMLLLGVFALSVSVLADLESRLGGNQKAAQQALNLAEAGLEHGRNMLRDAATPATSMPISPMLRRANWACPASAFSLARATTGCASTTIAPRRRDSQDPPLLCPPWWKTVEAARARTRTIRTRPSS